MSKKLIIESVSFGKVPYGPGCGTTSLGIFFKEVEGEYDYKTPDTEDKDKIPDQNEIIAHGLYMDLVEALKTAKLENRWSEVLLAKNYVYFVGDCIAAPEHREHALDFLALIDASALQIQKKVITDNIKDSEQQKAALMQHLCSPLTCFVCSPTYYTASTEFYQAFRLVICKYPLAKDAIFNQLACIEIGHPPFTVVIFDIDDFEKQKDIIESRYESTGAIAVKEDRVYLIDHTGNVDIAKYAIEKGYRLNRAMDYPGYTLNF